MRCIGRHNNAFPCLQLIELAGYFDLDFPIQYVDEGVERGGMFAEFLALIKGKQGDVTASGFGDLAGYHCTGLVFHQGSEIKNFGFGYSRYGFLLLDGVCPLL